MADVLASTQDVESAFEKLQPLRDLAKNWDIDIAACLEDYLRELIGNLPAERQIEVTRNLNFHEAGIVLHNTANVYNRKVDVRGSV